MLSGTAALSKPLIGDSIDWRHVYDDISPTTTQAFTGSDVFSVDGFAITKDVALVGLGWVLMLNSLKPQPSASTIPTIW